MYGWTWRAACGIICIMVEQQTVWGSRSIADRIVSGFYDFAVEREWLARLLGLALWGTDTRLLYDDMRKVGELPNGSSILDVPSGGGVALRGLHPSQRVRYVAADISPDMLTRARRRAAGRGLQDIEYALADIERMQFPDNEFDLVVCFSGLHCLPNPAAAIREISRVLKPGGRLIGHTTVRGAGWRQDLAYNGLRRAGVAYGGTADELRGWLAQPEACLRTDHFELSGAIAHFVMTKPS